MSPELLAGLSEGQRTIAHLVVLLVLPVAVALVYLIRRKMRRPDPTQERRQTPEEH
jgi:hypothetical protein